MEYLPGTTHFPANFYPLLRGEPCTSRKYPKVSLYSKLLQFHWGSLSGPLKPGSQPINGFCIFTYPKRISPLSISFFPWKPYKHLAFTTFWNLSFTTHVGRVLCPDSFCIYLLLASCVSSFAIWKLSEIWTIPTYISRTCQSSLTLSALFPNHQISHSVPKPVVLLLFQEKKWRSKLLMHR